MERMSVYRFVAAVRRNDYFEKRNSSTTSHLNGSLDSRTNANTGDPTEPIHIAHSFISSFVLLFSNFSLRFLLFVILLLLLCLCISSFVLH